jgi:hypothetical protein
VRETQGLENLISGVDWFEQVRSIATNSGNEAQVSTLLCRGRKLIVE